MPELPEVETVVRGLAKFLPGKKVVGVDFDWPKSFPNAKADVDNFLIGASVVSVRRRGKAIIIELSSKYSLVVHLKMTGQLVYVGAKKRYAGGHPNDSLINELPDKSTRVTLDLKDAKLFFNDQRKFGWMRLIPTAEIPMIDFFRTIGPEPLSKNFTSKDFKKRLMKRPRSNIKAVLLDQKIIAGVGNIYADESLFAARIHPETLVRDISTNKMNQLYKELRDVLNLSIKLGGSTDKNYVDAEGKKGSYLKFAKVFRRENQPCPRCGATIIKTRVAGRGTHICPKCQKPKKVGSK